MVFEDGVCTVFLNTKGENRDEVPKELVALLDFVKADLAASEADYKDPFVEQLQHSMRRIKTSRKMGERYMMFEQYMEEYLQEHADEIREEALEEGEEKGMARLNKLNSLLLAANRLSDLQRALQDPEYQKQLFQEFGI